MLRIAGSFLVLFLISSVAGPQNPTAPPWDLQSAVHYFDYDSAQPLAIQDKVVQETSDFTIQDITYASPKGGRVPAYLIVPKGKGPFAAILF
jgi:hypothetical protein